MIEHVGQNLYEAIVRGYDDVQNIMHLLHGLDMMLDGAEIEHDDKWAMQGVIQAAQAIGREHTAKLNAANEADGEALRLGSVGK